MDRALLIRSCWILMTAGSGFICAASVAAAPTISSISLRGLQIGTPTTLVIEGQQLAPDTRVLLEGPIASQAVSKETTPQRAEVQVTVDERTPPGIYLLRVASRHGVSEAVAVGIDRIPQMAFSSQINSLPAALTGALTGNTVLATSLVGRKGQPIVVDVESRRLGASLNPIVRLYDKRRVQIGWSHAVAAINGDARFDTVLPSDGQFTIELHDALFRGEDPGFFRLKVGDLYYADLVYPVGVTLGASRAVQYVSTNLPAAAKAVAMFPASDIFQTRPRPAPWPDGYTAMTGSRPRVVVSDFQELVEEAQAAGKTQSLTAAPVAVSGRLSKPGEDDRYHLTVRPGQKLRFEVLAERVGSPLDGILSVRDAKDLELANNDDRKETRDPLIDLTVPSGVSELTLSLRDLERRGGPQYVYRLSAVSLDSPDFTLSMPEPRVLVPSDGAGVLRVHADRREYTGPIKISLEGLPADVKLEGTEIPEHATDTLITLSAPGRSPTQSIISVSGEGAGTSGAMKRPAVVDESRTTKAQPWLRDSLAMAVTPPTGLQIDWADASSDAKLVAGSLMPLKVKVTRGPGLTGSVRLRLMTSQDPPRKIAKVNFRDTQVEDTDRAIRFQGVPVVLPDAKEQTAEVIVPGDLAWTPYDLAIRAELLAADAKTVVASAVTPARRLQATGPMKIELAGPVKVEARAGVGSTGKLTGKIIRAAGFTAPAVLRLVALPGDWISPRLTVGPDKNNFQFDIDFPYGTAPGALKGVKLVATSHADPKRPGVIVRSNEVPIEVTVVAGSKPAPEKPLKIFEDESDFVASLTQGNAQTRLELEDRYSGTGSLKVMPEHKTNPSMPGMNIKIRQHPGPGEYRYLQYAWKKQGNPSICLQLAHEGQFGPTPDRPEKFRYHAGPVAECLGASISVDVAQPLQFTLVTRDLYADFGEFTLTGFGFSAIDDQHAIFDHIYLGKSPSDFELAK